MTPEAQRFVTTPDGLRLAVFTDGEPAAPPVLLVHGYPDTHRVWDDVTASLAADHYVIRYDVRGAGASQRPANLAGYRIDRLADDLFAVLDAVSPDRKAHVAGHDWGSIQSWEAVTESRAAGRIASYTTISGPCLDHAGFWLRDRFTSRSPRRVAQAFSQAAHSWYVWFFQVPVIPEFSWRLWMTRAWPGLLQRLEGVTPRDGHPAGTLASDAVNGISLYRANILRRLGGPRMRIAQVPVQLVTVTGDHFVTPALAGSDLDRWAPDLVRHTVRGTHWSVLDKRVADLIREFAAGRRTALRPATGKPDRAARCRHRGRQRDRPVPRPARTETARYSAPKPSADVQVDAQWHKPPQDDSQQGARECPQPAKSEIAVVPGDEAADHEVDQDDQVPHPSARHFRDSVLGARLRTPSRQVP